MINTDQLNLNISQIKKHELESNLDDYSKRSRTTGTRQEFPRLSSWSGSHKWKQAWAELTVLRFRSNILQTVEYNWIIPWYYNKRIYNHLYNHFPFIIFFLPWNRSLEYLSRHTHIYTHTHIHIHDICCTFG